MFYVFYPHVFFHSYSFCCLFLKNIDTTITYRDTHNQWEWRPWDLLMLFAAAVLWIHKRPCGTPGGNGALDMLFVKMAGKCAGELAMQLTGDTGMNMYCMLMSWLLTQAVDESRGHVHPSPLSGGSAIDKTVVDAATSLATVQWQVADISDSSQGDTARCSLWTRRQPGLRHRLLILLPPWPLVVRHSEVISEGPKANVSN